MITLAYKKFGIDISNYQKGIDFTKIVAEKAEFVILRGAYHLSKDAQFEEFYKKAKQKKLPVGVYVYTMAKTVSGAKQEAQFLIDSVLKGKKFELPVYFDIEDEIYYSKTPSENSQLVRAFCDTLEEKGFFSGVYSSLSFFENHLDDSMLKTYAHWVAQWSKECTYKNKDILGMWQFGGETNEIRSNKIAGYVCDQNYMLTDYPKIIKEQKLNGFGGEKPSEVTGSMKKGDKGIGVYLLKKNLTILGKVGKISQKLDDNGIYGDGTEDAVKQVQKLNGLKQDGIVDAKTVKAIEKMISDLIK